jgi:hypothetical protein
MNSPNPALRRPGGQPGNTNAIKHGFYSPRIRQNQSGHPHRVKYTGVRDEIDLLRMSIRRVVDWGEDIQSLPDALTFLRILALASISLSRLVRAQQVIADSDYELAIGRAVSDISEELGEADPSEELGDAEASEELDEADPTEEWARADPPEGSNTSYQPEFDPSRYGDGVKDG